MKALLTATMLGLVLAPMVQAAATTYAVNSYRDDGPGTLRWAIAQSNAHPGDNVIRIGAVGKAPYVIKLKSLLPALKGPVTVEGITRATKAGDMAPAIAIDGSAFIDGDDQKSCPGFGGHGNGPNVRSMTGPGLAMVDTDHVQIRNLEIRSFCIGIMILRSRDNRIDHNWIHNMAGAAGILITGDDGSEAGGSTAGLTAGNVVEYNRIYQTGDGGECTRGVTDLTYRFNIFWELRNRPNMPYSQGVECAGAGVDRIRFIGNSFAGYSDGLQLNSATNVLVAGNTITGTTYGITASGSALITGNTLSGNRLAIGPTPTAQVTISQNSIFDNGHGDILSVAGSAGGTTDAASPNKAGIVYVSRGAASAPPPSRPAAPAPQPPSVPALSGASRWDKTPVLSGTLAAQPNATFRIEFFASRGLDAAGVGEGETFIGATAATTDAAGNAGFSFDAPANPLGDGGTKAYFTATATGSSGATSAFSPALMLGR